MQNPVFERIRQEIADNEIVLYMKGTAVFPQCGYSAAVAQVLDNLGARYKDVDVLIDPGLHQGLKEFAQWPAVPQLYIRGQFIGGADAVSEIYASGVLKQILAESQLIPQ